MSQMIALLSGEGIGSGLLCFDLSPQLENFGAQATERFGWRLDVGWLGLVLAHGKSNSVARGADNRTPDLT